MSRKIQGYGWTPDLPDGRDCSARRPSTRSSLPGRVDLRKQCLPVHDQDPLGGCPANAIGAALSSTR